MLVKFEENKKDKKSEPILGGIKIEPIPIVIGISYALVVLYTYYMAAILKDEVPAFPHTTITMTATYFPQNIAFRFIITPQIGCITLLYIGIYYILIQATTEVKKINRSFKLGGFWEECCTLKVFSILSVISIIMLGIAVTTIDSGYMNNTLHDDSAVIGFVGMFITMVMMTIFFAKLQPYNPELIKEKSLKVKKTIVTIQLAIFLYIVYKTLYPDSTPTNQVDWQTSVAEYTLYYAMVAFFYSFRYDFEGYYFFWGIKQAKKNQAKIISQIPILQPQQLYVQIPVSNTQFTPVYQQPQQQQVIVPQVQNIQQQQPYIYTSNQQVYYQYPTQKQEKIGNNSEQNIELVEKRSVYPQI